MLCITSYSDTSFTYTCGGFLFDKEFWTLVFFHRKINEAICILIFNVKCAVQNIAGKVN